MQNCPGIVGSSDLETLNQSFWDQNYFALWDNISSVKCHSEPLWSSDKYHQIWPFCRPYDYEGVKCEGIILHEISNLSRYSDMNSFAFWKRSKTISVSWSCQCRSTLAIVFRFLVVSAPVSHQSLSEFKRKDFQWLLRQCYGHSHIRGNRPCPQSAATNQRWTFSKCEAACSLSSRCNKSQTQMWDTAPSLSSM